MDFTIFYGDTRIFSTIVNENGSSAVGTKAEKNVIDEVVKKQKEFFYRRVEVSGSSYMGYYIPLMSGHDVIGMYFAGKSVKKADTNVNNAAVIFITVSLVILAGSLTACMVTTEKMVRDLTDIRKYITSIAGGDFTAELKEHVPMRDDEIGDIGKHAQILCTNLRDMVERDPLTMLLNRRSCRLKLEELIESRTLYTAVMGDIDYFKSINDTHGHACGDYVLKEISTLLKRHAEKHEGFVSRWGGEEFLIIFPETSVFLAKQYTEDILNELRSSEYCFEDKTMHITMTFGVAQNKETENADLTINRADELLYKGKDSGRNRIEM